LNNSLLKAQNENPRSLKDKISFSGYIRYMNSSSVINSDSIISDNLIHNRLRLKADFSSKLSAVVEMRNRAFFGEKTNLNPKLGNILDQDIGNLDFSVIPHDSRTLVIHSIFDRAYLKYSTEKWEFRIGRQRINWGVNLAWNPNDLFNSYSLIDFDYQERSGVDALRFQYYTGEMSSIEFAAQPGENINKSIFAGLWRFNLSGNDFQILLGNYYFDYALGIGWAGNYKNTGVKFESTYFSPKKNSMNSSNVFSSSISFDYSTKKGIYLNSSVLYNSDGKSRNTSSENLFGSFLNDISAKNLMPARVTYFLQISGNFTPAISGSFSNFYMKGEEMLLLMPSLTYEVKENFDSMLLGQFVFDNVNSNFNSVGIGIFIRVSYNF
jgi:hypothetical protein|tara:strand:- start:29605 stop:30747 length:1143 start_codon:yes stop_codon:yes gene_type:complete